MSAKSTSQGLVRRTPIDSYQIEKHTRRETRLYRPDLSESDKTMIHFAWHGLFGHNNQLFLLVTTFNAYLIRAPTSWIIHREWYESPAVKSHVNSR